MAGTAVQRRLTWLLADVVELIEETPRVKSIVLDVPGWTGHLPGQHVDLRLTAEDGYQAQRSYSIATPADGERLAITVELVEDGEVSPFLLEELAVGDRLELRGPIGGYFVWEPAEGGSLQLVGGGSGVVPLMAMIRAWASQTDDVRVRLLASSRTYEDIIYRAELEDLASGNAWLAVTHTLTRSQPAGWQGPSRRVDETMLREVTLSPDEGPLCFVCGPTGFVETVASALVRLGHRPENVKTERFGPTGGPS